MSALPLEGITVVSVEQAVAAPFATRQLADLGARVIKIERDAGDFARGYAQLLFWVSRWAFGFSGGFIGCSGFFYAVTAFAPIAKSVCMTEGGSLPSMKS